MIGWFKYSDWIQCFIREEWVGGCLYVCVCVCVCACGGGGGGGERRVDLGSISNLDNHEQWRVQKILWLQSDPEGKTLELEEIQLVCRIAGYRVRWLLLRLCVCVCVCVHVRGVLSDESILFKINAT